MSETSKEWMQKFPNGDMPTHIGMRRALAEAVSLYKAGEYQAIRSDQEKVAFAKKCLHDAVNHEGSLVGAGTGEVVKAYFDNVVDSLKPHTKILDFINGVQASDAVNALKSADLGNKYNLAAAAFAFSHSAKTHLGMQTLTQSFEGFLHSHNAMLEKATIHPGGFTHSNIVWLQRQEKLLHEADHIPFTGDPVMDNIPPVNPKNYPQRHASIDKQNFVALCISGGQEVHNVAAPLLPKNVAHASSQGLA